MINELNIYYLVPLLLLMIMMVTGAWKKSISTLVFIGALTVSGFMIKNGYISEGMFVLMLSAFILELRAIYNHEEDQLIKR